MRQLNIWTTESPPDVKTKEISHKAKSYTGLYGLHKYWGKKPYNIMADFIQKYSHPNDIVLDPFLGSGVSITEAIFSGRKGFGIDINPSATFITEQIIANINPTKLLEEYNRIEDEVRETIDKFYSVKRNGSTYIGQNYLWEEGELTEIRYSNGTRKRYSTEPTDTDRNLAESFTHKQIEYFFPKVKFFHNSRINAKGNHNVSDLFTSRNLNALAILFDRLNRIKDEKLRNIFLFCFTSCIGQASKMVFVIKRRNKTKENGSASGIQKKEVGSWVIGYWTPTDFFENNAWTCFETRFKKMLKAKKEQFNQGFLYKGAADFNQLLKSDYLIANSPSQEYLKTIKSNSIDYILTDPPHGNRIPYLELSMLWNSWLNKEVDYDSEIVVSESKERQKTITEYNALLNEVLEESYRVLKPERHLSFMFNSLDDKAWLNIVNTFHSTGFELVEIETLDYSANSVVQDNRKNGLQTDFIITYKKPVSKQSVGKELEVISLGKDDLLLKIVQDMVNRGFKPFQVMNRIYCELLRAEKFVRPSELMSIISNE